MNPLVTATNTGEVECSEHYRHIIMNPLVIATNTGVLECSKHYHYEPFSHSYKHRSGRM